jgi:hypothetical protein
LANPDSFDPTKVGVFLLRCLCYELVDDAPVPDPPELPEDWKVVFSGELFSWATWAVVFGSIVCGIYLFFHRGG